jgi:hypothetical protein
MIRSKYDPEFDKLLIAYKNARPVLMARAATMAITFFKENFRRQGFLDRTLKPWEKRIQGSPSNKPLEINRGFLRRGVMKKRVTATQATVGVDPSIKYAEIQNNGGLIPVTNKMRRFFWAMYYKNGSGKEEGKSKRATALNGAAEFWKNLALTKKTHIEIKARPFIDDSWTLEQEIFDMFDNEIYKIVNPG